MQAVLSLSSRVIAVLPALPHRKDANRPPPQGAKPKGRVAQLVEHSTLNRLVVGSIPTASTSFLPIFQALTVTGSFAPTMRFPKPDQKPDQTFFAGCAG